MPVHLGGSTYIEVEKIDDGYEANHDYEDESRAVSVLPTGGRRGRAFTMTDLEDDGVPPQDPSVLPPAPSCEHAATMPALRSKASVSLPGEAEAPVEDESKQVSRRGPDRGPRRSGSTRGVGEEVQLPVVSDRESEAHEAGSERAAEGDGCGGPQERAKGDEESPSSAETRRIDGGAPQGVAGGAGAGGGDVRVGAPAKCCSIM